MDQGESIGCGELRGVEGGENKVGMREDCIFNKKLNVIELMKFKQLLTVVK